MADVPWVNLDPFDLLGRVEALGKHDFVIDWGCGKNESPISKHVKELTCERLYSVDAWPENIQAVDAQLGEYRADWHEVVRTEVQEFAASCRKNKGFFDLSLCLDIVEHLDENKATEWLQNVEAISRRVLIWIPLGPAIMENDWWGNNHYWQTHRSQWTKEDLESLGYACEVLENFHTPMFNTRVDGCWACKEFV